MDSYKTIYEQILSSNTLNLPHKSHYLDYEAIITIMADRLPSLYD
jgi:hypothetical protein